MGFDAGNIEAYLTVDRDPFQVGLDLAKAEAQEFADHRYTATFDINSSTAIAKAAAIAGIGQLGDDAARDTEELNKLGPSAGGAGDGIDKLGRDADSAARSLGGGSGHSGLLGALLPLAPALVPIAGVATGAGIGIADAFLAAGAGVAAFAVAAGPELSGTKDRMTDLLHSFQAVAAPDVIPVLNASVGLFKTVLQSANPLVGAASSALLQLEDRAKSSLQSPAWASFTTFIDAEAGPAITTFGTVLGNLGHGFGNLLQTFAPVETEMENGLVSLSQGFENWTSSTGGAQSFLTWFQGEAPQVGTLIENLAHVVGDLLAAFGGWGQIIISVANPLLSLTNTLFKVNPVLGDITAALIIGGLAWSKWGSAISGAFGVVGNLPSKLSTVATGLGSLSLRASAVAPLLGGVGAASAGAGIGVAGLGASLATVGAVALPLGAVIAAFAIGSGEAADQAHQLSSDVDRLTTGMAGAGAKTIPQLSASIAINGAEMSLLKDKVYQANEAMDQQNATVKGTSIAYTAQVGALNEALTPAIQRLRDENSKLNAEMAAQKGNLLELNSAFTQAGLGVHVTSQSANELASTIGINLNKALTTTQIQQFVAHLQQMASSTGITASALENLSQISGQTVGDITKAISAAETTTQKAFSGSFDAIKSLGTGYTALAQPVADTSDQIAQFYADSVSQGRTWSSDVQSLLSSGFDPTFMSQIIQAGPAQTIALVQGLVNGEGTNLLGIVSQGNAALQQQSNEAVQIARITQMAITAPTSAIAAALPTAINIQQTIATQGMAATVQSVAHALNLGVPQVQQISDEYGLGLPTAIQQQQVNTYLQALAQAQQVSNAQSALIGSTALTAATHATALPSSIVGQISPTSAAAVLQGGAVTGGLNQSAPGAAGAASLLSGGVWRNLQIGDTFSLGANAGNALAAGLSSALQGALAAAAAVV